MGKRKLEIMKTPPIILSGCARSGTSLVAAIVHYCGAFGGKMTGVTKHNQKGQFENSVIRDKVEKPFLRKIGVDHLGQKPIANTEEMKIPVDWKDVVERTMIEQGYKDGPWFYKGAKACQIWPVWNYAFPDAKWLIIRRRSADIAESCLKTGFMQRYNTFEGWIEWVNIHERKWKEMHEAGIQFREVWPDRFVERGDYSQVQEAIEWLGLKWNPTAVMQHVEPRLWNTRKKLNNG